MTTYWANLNHRERWTLGFGVSCTMIYLFYLLVYAPLTQALIDKQQQINEKIETLQWMKEVRQQPINSKSSITINDSKKLLAIIATRLNTASFLTFPHQLQQTGSGDIQLSFDAVPWLYFLKWLWALSNDYTISIKQLITESSSTPGIVKITLIITLI